MGGEGWEVMMAKEIVYRIQGADGRGPFKPGFSHRWVEDREDHDNLLPWGAEFGRVDRKVMTFEHCGSGCRTVEQLRRWFTPTEYKKLLSYGYKAVKMEADRVLGESNIQLFFTRIRPLREGVVEIELYSIAKDSTT